MKLFSRVSVLFLICVTSAILLFAGQTVRGDASNRTQVNKHDPVASMIFAVQAAHFEPQNRFHQIRKQRIEHYLTLARKYDDNDWDYSRDDALERAQNILAHHQSTTGGNYAGL